MPNQSSPDESLVAMLVRVQAIIPVIAELKAHNDTMRLILEGRQSLNQSEDKPSLIGDVKKLKEQMTTKIDKESVDRIFLVQERELKLQMEITEDLPELEKRVEALEHFIKVVKNIPGWFNWIPAVLTSAVLTLVINIVLLWLRGWK